MMEVHKGARIMNLPVDNSTITLFEAIVIFTVCYAGIEFAYWFGDSNV